VAVAGGCDSSPDNSEDAAVIQVMTVGVPVPFEVEVEVPVEVTVEVEVEKVVVQTVETLITPTPALIPITEID
jgi:hypothetical protein